jgi:hypothetical protein
MAILDGLPQREGLIATAQGWTDILATRGKVYACSDRRPLNCARSSRATVRSVPHVLVPQDMIGLHACQPFLVFRSTPSVFVFFKGNVRTSLGLTGRFEFESRIVIPVIASHLYEETAPCTPATGLSSTVIGPDSHIVSISHRGAEHVHVPLRPMCWDGGIGGQRPGRFPAEYRDVEPLCWRQGSSTPLRKLHSGLAVRL